MFLKFEKGTKEVHYGYECWLPPVGFGVLEKRLPDKSHEYLLEETEIIKRSSNPKEQYWERQPLPENFEKKVRQQEIQRQTDPKYHDPDLLEFQKQEWRRRRLGVWVWINGKMYYLTGLHYFYLQWWPIDGGYPQYRDVDRRVFYVIQYCMEDPDCLGLLEVTSRRSGKTFRSGCWLYERISRNKQVNGGIQSKTDDDGKKMYLKAVMTPWTKLPFFFRPTYNIAKGDKPENGLYFFKRSRRGAAAMEDDGLPQLESQITFQDSRVFSYDGDALYAYISDECGKLKDVDIVERHDVVRFCATQQGVFIGKQYYTTTVEDADVGGKNLQRLWDNSDPEKRNEVNQTTSGLYRIFTPASEYEGQFDKYGFTDVVANETRIRAIRASKQTKKELYDVIRKNPLTVSEAFRFNVDGEPVFDNDAIYTQMDALELYTGAERGNFAWKDNKPLTEVIWVPHRDGRWERYWDFPIDENGHYKYLQPNMVDKRGLLHVPINKHQFAAGVDPFSHGEVQDRARASLAAAFVKLKHNPHSDDPFNGHMVCMYHSRPATVSIFHDDMLKMAWYYGTELLFENNKNNWDDYFKLQNCEAFLMQLQEYSSPGIPGNDKNVERFVDLIELDLAQNAVGYRSDRLLTQMAGFEFHNRTKYDLVMAWGYTLIADDKRGFRTQAQKNIEVTSLVRRHKITAA